MCIIDCFKGSNRVLKKVLIIKMSALGDVFMALPHVDVILSHHGEDQVWMLTSPPFRDVFVDHPGLRVALLDRNKKLSRESRWSRVLWVRKKRFAAVYDLQGNRTSRMLVRFSGAPIRVGTQPRSAVYNFHPESFYARNTQQNVFDRLNETLSSAGLPQAKVNCAVYPSAADIDRVLKWREEQGLLGEQYALIHAASSSDWPSKRWPRNYFLQLALLVKKAGIRCIWVGSNEDRDVNRRLAEDVGIDATDEFNLLQLYLMGKGAKFAVTNDSGPMHVLAASGIPVYSFFGPTSWIRSHAIGQKERVLKKDIECSPCFFGECPPRKAHACLNQIKPKDVFLKIAKELNI